MRDDRKTITINPSKLISPHFAYLIVWAPLLYLFSLNLFFFSAPNSFFLTSWLVGLIVNFFLIYIFVDKVIFSNLKQNKNIAFSTVDLFALKSFIKYLFVIWLFLYLLTILYSGGIPFLWQLMGDPRTYSNFGIPTVGGFINMTRVFMLSSCVIFYLYKIPVPKLTFVLLLMSLILGLDRASILFAFLAMLCTFYMFNKFTFKKIVPVILLLIGLVALFGFIADFRFTGNNQMQDPSDFLNNDILPMASLLWVLLYYVTPLNNVYYNYFIGFDPSYSPYFTLQGLLPTVIRDRIFSGGNDGGYSAVFATENFNTTAYVQNIISDFGFLGAYMVISIIQFYVSYIFRKAKNQSTFHLLIYPSLFSAVVLSVFFNMFFSLVVVMYPLLTYLFMKYRVLYIKNLN